MSVLFATVLPNAVILCADKLAMNLETGESFTTKKIEQWSPTIAVGGIGCFALDEMIISGVRQHVKESGLDNFTLEEIAEAFGQCYYAIVETYSDMPKDAHAQFVVAGKLSNGKVGAIQIMVRNDEADMEIIEARDMPATIIFAPEDLSNEDCNQLLTKAIRNTAGKKNNTRDIMEAVHRKAVRYVSEHSKYVGPKADYIVIRA